MNRRTVIGLAAAAVGIILVVGAAVAWILTRSESADDAAERYLSALSRGDFAEIETFLPDALDAEETGRLGAAFTSATGYVEDYDFTVSDAGEGRWRVDADVELEGERGTVAFVLGESDGGWELQADYLGVLEVSTPLGDAVRVGDALTALSVELLPAVYPVDPAPAGILVGGTEAAVTSPGSTTVMLEPSLGPDATPLAQQQIDAYAQRCASATDAVPDACGLRVPWAADLVTLDAIAFRIDSSPSVVLAPDGRSFAATGGAIVATATGTDDAGSTASFTYRADDWTLRGTLAFSGDEMSLLVD